MAATFFLSTIAAGAMVLAPVDAGRLPSAVTSVAADCNGAASAVVNETGGRLLSVQVVNQGGQVVCKITVLVPGKGNARPRKETRMVPL